MSSDFSEINAKIFKAFFSQEDSDDVPDFCKNRDDAWRLVYKLEEQGHRVFH